MKQCAILSASSAVARITWKTLRYLRIERHGRNCLKKLNDKEPRRGHRSCGNRFVLLHTQSKDVSTIRKPNAGDTVYVATTRHNRDKGQYEVAVKKVGRKYFYTRNPTNPHFDLAFEIGNFVDGAWDERPESADFCAGKWKAYISREVYEKWQKKEYVLRRIKSDSMLDRPYRQIMALAEVLETDFELEDWEK